MIHVLELPAQGEPRAWFAFDDDDFARKLAAGDRLEEWEIYDETTPRSLLDALGHPEVNDAAQAAFPALYALGEQHGWDQPLWRADHLLGSGVLSTDAISPRDAWAAALAARPGIHRLYWDDSAALAAFEGAEPLLQGREHWYAKRALYEQLVALDILADDN